MQILILDSPYKTLISRRFIAHAAQQTRGHLLSMRHSSEDDSGPVLTFRRSIPRRQQHTGVKGCFAESRTGERGLNPSTCSSPPPQAQNQRAVLGSVWPHKPPFGCDIDGLDDSSSHHKLCGSASDNDAEPVTPLASILARRQPLQPLTAPPQRAAPYTPGPNTHGSCFPPGLLDPYTPWLRTNGGARRQLRTVALGITTSSDSTQCSRDVAGPLSVPAIRSSSSSSGDSVGGRNRRHRKGRRGCVYSTDVDADGADATSQPLCGAGQRCSPCSSNAVGGRGATVCGQDAADVAHPGDSFWWSTDNSSSCGGSGRDSAACGGDESSSSHGLGMGASHRQKRQIIGTKQQQQQLMRGRFPAGKSGTAEPNHHKNTQHGLDLCSSAHNDQQEQASCVPQPCMHWPDKPSAAGTGQRQPPASCSEAAAGKVAAPVCAARRFARVRQQLATQLYAEWNALVFGGRLPSDLPLVWNPRLVSTAGQVVDDGSRNASKTLPGERIAVRLELSPKVLDSEARLRNTLAHEMCHVGAWAISHDFRQHHGVGFKSWARAFEAAVPGLAITTRHTYETHMPHRWQCSNASCQKVYSRHRNSIDPARHVCSACRGRLTYLGRFARDGSNKAATVGAKAPPSGFALFVQRHFAEIRRTLPPGTPHGRVMSSVAAAWRETRAADGGEGGAAMDKGGANSVNLMGTADTGSDGGKASSSGCGEVDAAGMGGTWHRSSDGDDGGGACREVGGHSTQHIQPGAEGALQPPGGAAGAAQVGLRGLAGDAYACADSPGGGSSAGVARRLFGGHAVKADSSHAAVGGHAAANPLRAAVAGGDDLDPEGLLGRMQRMRLGI